MVISTITFLSTIYKQTTESTGALLNALPTVRTTINESLWKAGLSYLLLTNNLLTTITRQTDDRQNRLILLTIDQRTFD